jgi:hypothetical protein
MERVEDTAGLLRKRVYDMASSTVKNVKVFLNNGRLKVKNFKQYIEMYLSSGGAVQMSRLVTVGKWHIRTCLLFQLYLYHEGWYLRQPDIQPGSEKPDYGYWKEEKGRHG